MSDHIPDLTKMISDTPISDSTPHNVGDLGMLCRRLEREFHAANERIKRLEYIIEKASKHFRSAGPNAFTAYEMANVLKEAKP
jgi:hypothetical protein